MKTHTFLAIVLLWISRPVLAIPTYAYDSANQIVGVNGVEVEGETWDMLFHGGAFYELQNGPWKSLYEVSFAIKANSSFLSFYNSNPPISDEVFAGCESSSCGFATAYDLVFHPFQQNVTVLVTGLYDMSKPWFPIDTDFSPWLPPGDVMWGTWEKAVTVSEPPVAMLLATGLAIFGVIRRKVRS